MSDKSFGDHHNRNIVKNPLLSTAVTGLCLEDLTHKTVLLPAAPTQGLAARPDEQTQSQTSTLLHSDHETSNFPAGDANSNLPPTILPINTNQNKIDTQKSVKHDKIHETSSVSQSNAIAKSEDDFDVNEYFARLQGTRYVSAPLHSHLKDDTNSNLDTAEENLEEINLNDNQNTEVEATHSFTADIAQNFSQLPAALPHMASAVFSSFSNMLNLKSREQTPDVPKAPTSHQNVQLQRPEERAVQMDIIETGPPREVGPPPREPPSTGIGSYRMKSKMKYAQIPGLSSTSQHSQANSSYNTPTNTSSNDYFVPLVSGVQTVEDISQNTIEVAPESERLNDLPAKHNVLAYSMHNVPSRNESNIPDNSRQNDSNLFAPISQVEQTPPPSAAIIPPPPMFSNLPRRDSQSNVGKAILPASVARRIAANHPIIKPQVVQQTLAENIFVPASIPDTTSFETQKGFGPTQFTNTPVGVECVELAAPKATTSNVSQNLPPPSSFAFAQVNLTPEVSQVLIPSQSSNILSSPASMEPFSNTVPLTTPIFAPIPQSTDNPPPTFFNPNTASVGSIPQNSQASPLNLPMPESKKISNLPPPPSINPNVPFASTPAADHGKVSAFVSGTPRVPSEHLPPPPIFYNPTALPVIPKSLNITTPPSKGFFNPAAIAKPVEQEFKLNDPQDSIPPALYNPNAHQFQVQPTLTAAPHQLNEPFSSIEPTPEIRFFNPATEIKTIDQVAPNEPQRSVPQSFFNPNTYQAQAQTDIDTFRPPPATQLFSNPPSETSKPPVKSLTGNGKQSYRMTKKRPQYYSGPIEGVGAISNIKPALPPVDITPIQNPSLPSGSVMQNTPLIPPSVPEASTPFSGALFTPRANIHSAHIDNTAPFDISRPDVAPVNTPYDIKKPQETAPPAYNSYFDLSRATTEKYEKPKEDSKGFGLIGSLKSKLSSLDINKIQSSVTTFFDPAYNDTKKDTIDLKDNVPYDQQAYGQASNQGTIDIFVPNTETTELHSYGYTQQYASYDQSSYVQSQLPSNMYPSSTNYYSDQQYQEYPPSYSQDIVKQNYSSLPSQETNQMPQVFTPHGQSYNSRYLSDIQHNVVTSADLKTENVSQTATENVVTSVDQTAATTHLIKPPSLDSITTQTQPKLSAQSFFDDVQGASFIPDQVPSENNVPKPPIFFNPDVFQSKNIFTSNVQKPAELDKTSEEYSPFIQEQTYQGPAIGQIVKKPTDLTKTEDETTPFPFEQREIESTVNQLPLFSGADIVASCIAKIDSEFSESTVMPVLTDYSHREGVLSDKESLVKKPVHPTEVENVVAGFSDPKETAREVPKTEINLLESLSKPVIPIVGVATAPLFGLSTIIADVSKDIAEVDQAEILRDVAKKALVLDQNSSLSFFENFKRPNEVTHGNATNLDIIETCRDDNKYESGEENDNVTTQLIENITSRIQLSNSVEVPLKEGDIPVGERDTINAEQLENQIEISQISDQTVETIQGQTDMPYSEVKLTSEAVDYGWKALEDMLYPNPTLENFGLNVDDDASTSYKSHSLFFNDVPKNASDEIKAEYKNSHDDIILPRQMSLPSAPPAEDEVKSDVAGVLDVNSIEQDAKNDFPIDEEEFLIEPSETDDDKIEYIEREKSAGDGDTFTDRVERFQKVVVDDDVFENIQVFNAPAISMASYFDTGNYAAETHYRNSLKSPSTIQAFQESSNTAMCIPPGFEDECNVISNSASFNDSLFPAAAIPETNTQTPHTCTITDTRDITHVPETNTQTPFTCTVTETKSITPTCEFKFATVTTTASELSHGLPPFATIFGAKNAYTTYDSKNDKTEDGSRGISAIKEKHAASAMGVKNEDANSKTDTTPAFTGFGKIETPLQAVKEMTSLFADTNLKETPTQPLPDPINFFASADPSQPVESDNSLNRLASYFSTPATQPDHSKSFFELSQSQNHYRHAHNTCDEQKTSNKPDYNRDLISNIPNEQYIANLNLMKELSSPQNLTFDSNTIIKTVNFFTIELDAQSDTFKDRPENPKLNHSNELEDDSTDNDDSAIETILSKCELCCNFQFKVNFPNLDSNYKVKTTMNGKEQAVDANNSGMEAKDENKSDLWSTLNPFGSDNYKNDDEANNTISVTVENRSSSEYTPVTHHWFYRVDVEEKSTWRGFSISDSKALEEAFVSPGLDDSTLVPTDGGRYDVNILGRLRMPVYWKDKPTNVRRCSWFYKGTTDARYVPYTEAVAERLEEEYHLGMVTGVWHRRLPLPNSELVVLHGPAVMVHFLNTPATDAYTTAPSATCPRVVRRCHDESEIEDSEPSSIDHLLLLCHGVGSACDMRFRPVEEVVEDFRETSFQLLQSHYRNSYDNGVVNRVEVLPISWHSKLHSGETGVDRRLAQITLDSIPRLRNFTNDTVLDVLFYTSPVYCQTILDTVCSELNRIYNLFKSRNPGFTGGVSLGGHSLGSVILYDLLCHQCAKPQKDIVDKTYVNEKAPETGLKYPQLEFEPATLYALGSPIAIFECIRGVEGLGKQFALPTCKNFFNIFHPFDPIAYRIEPLINADLKDYKPYQIPHHKGRKRMHLELKDTMARVGADLKQKLIESLRTTWNLWKAQPPTDGQLEKVVEEELEKEPLNNEEELAKNTEALPEMLGHLNSGRRVDYVLQEAPLEMINEYLFAMRSHVGYWESEDTMLLMLREIYDALGVRPDCTVPQGSMTVQRIRTVKDETISIGTAEIPSTSYGGT